LFKLKTGITDLPHIPYRGAGPALVDVVAGQIPMIVPAMTNHVLELHESAKLRVLAVTHHKRLAAAQNLPTAVEQGIADLVAPNFIGLYAPTGTPKAIIDQVAEANLKLLAEQSYRGCSVRDVRDEPITAPEQYKRYVEDEMARWRPIVPRWGQDRVVLMITRCPPPIAAD
jgi:tripartite-type tricarboxylate transporter receptor subunit TctC